ncbi:MAG: ribbon-helix-helix domain-containing protein [Actinomycetota bacterium]|nr:ribbon-helix-helix domain-containing protein [Actinomycetota bacterium]
MKTAISVPDETFDRASRRAKALGMSRSEFFARAADSYLDELDAHSVTRQIDAALQECGPLDESNATAVEAAHGLLHESDDEW